MITTVPNFDRGSPLMNTALGAAAAFLATSAPVLGQTLTDLGIPGNANYSRGIAASANGLVVVGSSGNTSLSPPHRFPLRWTQAQGLTQPSFAPGDQSGEVLAVNADGLVMVGYGHNFNRGSRPVIWNNGVPSVLAFLPGTISGFANAVSGDGSLVAGSSGTQACKWLGTAAPIALPLPSGIGSANATGVSGDGTVIVGPGNTSSLPRRNRAILWRTSGASELSRPSGWTDAAALAVNTDGTVVVGWGLDAAGVYTALRWENGVPEALGRLPNAIASYGRGVSGDGRIVVGDSGGELPLLWMRELGPVSFERLGVNWADWSSVQAVGISRDGRTIVGHGVRDHAQHAWMLRVPCVLAVTSDSVTTCPSEPVELRTLAAPVALPATLTYQWRIESPAGSGSYLTLDAPEFVEPATGMRLGISGDSSPALTVTTLALGSHGPQLRFRCRVASSCGSVTTSVIGVRVCASDYNCDGFTDFFDYDAFVACFEGDGCAPGRNADFNGDGFQDFFDYDDFVAAFETGC